jgi:F-type H+-transporting ATPase subunit epsilon
MTDSFAVEVVTPETTLYAGPATAVVLRTSIGSLTVMAGHAPFVGDVVPTEVKVEREGEPTMHLAVHGGFVQVDTSPDAAEGIEGADEGPISGLTTRVTLLAGVAENAEDIDPARAEAARADAQAGIDQLGTAQGEDAMVDVQRRQLQDALARAELRLQLASRPSA